MGEGTQEIHKKISHHKYLGFQSIFRQCLEDRPMEAVHHFELSPQIFLGQVVQHAGVHQTLHEVTAVLGESDGGQPLVTNPLVVHVSERQSLQTQQIEHGVNPIQISDLCILCQY